MTTPEPRPLSIGVAVGSFPPLWTSSATLYGALVDWLQERGQECEVLTLRPSEVEFPKENRSWVRSIRIGRAGQVGMALRAISEARRMDRDVFLVYSPLLPFAAAACIGARLAGTPVVVNVQDLHPKVLKSMGFVKNPLLLGVLGLAERIVYQLGGHFIVYSESNRDHLTSNGVAPGDVSIIENWVVNNSQQRRTVPYPHEDVVPRGSVQVLYAGAMGEAQDLLHWAEVAEQLAAEDSDVHIVMYGDGTVRAELDDRANSNRNLHVFDPVDPSEYQQLLMSVDVGLISLSETVSLETVPGKLANLLAARIPILASVPDAGDLARYIDQHGVGIQVRSGDVASSVSAARSLEDPAEVEKYREAIDKCVVQPPSVEEAGAQIELLLRRLARER